MDEVKKLHVVEKMRLDRRIKKGSRVVRRVRKTLALIKEGRKGRDLLEKALKIAEDKLAELKLQRYPKV